MESTMSSQDRSAVVPSAVAAQNLNAAINLRLALLGLPNAADTDGAAVASLMEPILARQRELSRRLADRLCPVDQRIQHFLNDYLAEIGQAPQLPRRTLVLDQPGLARGLSLPAMATPSSRRCSAATACATAFYTIRQVTAARRPVSSTSSKVACRFRTTNSQCRSWRSPGCWQWR